MKKITMITAIFLLVLSATFADKVISADQLSAGAKDFISKTFPGKTVQYERLISALMKLFSTTEQKSI